MSPIEQRMSELMEPINQQIMMCDNREDLLMLACAMMTTVKDIFDQEIGFEGRRTMFKDMI
jgi:hypothetical protein